MTGKSLHAAKFLFAALFFSLVWGHPLPAPDTPHTMAATWQIETISNTVATYDQTASLALDKAGKPHVSYHDSANAPTHRLKYAKKTGASWTEETVDQGLYVGWPSSIAIDPSGDIHIGYGQDDLVVYAHHSENAWATSVVDVWFDHWFQDISVVLDNAGKPHFGYYDWDTGEILYAYWDEVNEEWKPEVVDADGSFAAAIAWKNGVHMVYQDGQDLNYGKSAGGSAAWSTSTITQGSISRHALAVKPDGTPCIVYNEGSSLNYACGPSWTKQQIASSGSGASLGFDLSGTPHVVYSSSGVQYATLKAGGWVSEEVDSAGSYISNVVSQDPNEVRFLYVKAGELKYARGSGLITTDLIADSVEVTQAVQDLNNSVRLVAGKQTLVRFHVHSAADTFPTTAQLRVTSSAGSETLRPLNPGASINVRPAPNRAMLNHSFYFELPSKHTQGNVTLKAELNPAKGAIRNPWEKDYSNNSKTANVSFESVPVVPIVFYNVSYNIGGTTHRANESVKLVSWLRRAYPLPTLKYWTRTYHHSDARPTCMQVNNTLANKRWWDWLLAWRKIPKGTRYIGLVTDKGGFMRGCAPSSPSFTAATPTGDPATNWPWDTDGCYGDWYGAHELGHAYGRRHTRCSGTEARPDTSYPIPGGLIGVPASGNNTFFGFDVTTKRIYPPNWSDIMSYCTHQWISEYTSEALMDYFRIQLNPTSLAPVRQTVAQDRLLITGSIDPATDEVDVQPIFLIPDAEDLIPLIPGNYAIVLRNASGGQLARYAFTPEESHIDDGEIILFFSQLVPYVSGTTQVEIEGPGGVLTRIQAGINPPTVTLLSPNGGETLSGDPISVSWIASDPDGDSLTFNIQYSPDNGTSWEMVAQNLTQQSVDLEALNVVAGQQGLFRVWASDGIHSASDQSDAPFTVPNRTPQVTIVSPEAPLTIASEQTLFLEADVYDLDEGSMDEDQVQWSSNRDGSLGSSRILGVAGLSVGVHTITVEAQDGDGATGTDNVQVTVVGDISQLPLVPNELIAGPEPVWIIPGQNRNQVRLSVENKNSAQSIAWSANVDQSWLSLSESSGTTPYDELDVSFHNTGLADGLHTAAITFTSPDVPGQELVLDVTVEIREQYVFLPAVLR